VHLHVTIGGKTHFPDKNRKLFDFEGCFYVEIGRTVDANQCSNKKKPWCDLYCLREREKNRVIKPISLSDVLKKPKNLPKQASKTSNQ
jgi:hypothetical protein